VRQTETDTVEILTMEEFEKLPEEDAYKLELVRGRLVREPRPGAPHGRIMARLIARMEPYAEEHGLGCTYADVGFVIGEDPPTVRGPDIAFLPLETVHREGMPKSFWRVAPDLAVEIVSPSNTAADIQEKVLEYLGVGARLVWVVDPKTRSVTVFHSSMEIRLLKEGDDLEGGEVLPGFRLALAELFRLD